MYIISLRHLPRIKRTRNRLSATPTFEKLRPMSGVRWLFLSRQAWLVESELPSKGRAPCGRIAAPTKNHLVPCIKICFWWRGDNCWTGHHKQTICVNRSQYLSLNTSRTIHKFTRPLRFALGTVYGDCMMYDGDDCMYKWGPLAFAPFGQRDILQSETTYIYILQLLRVVCYTM